MREVQEGAESEGDQGRKGAESEGGRGREGAGAVLDPHTLQEDGVKG